MSQERKIPPEWASFGRSIARIREDKRLTIRQLSAATKSVQDAGDGVQPAQISRIENGKILPDLREVHLLLKALDVPRLEDVLGPAPASVPPWFVVRHADALKTLTKIRDERIVVKRSNEAHKRMTVDEKLYRYVPLNGAQSTSKEGDPRRLMQAYLLEVDYSGDDLIVEGLDTHDGEEVIYVLSGSIEFWHRADNSDQPDSITLRANDLVHFKSKLLHGYRSVGPTATALWVYLPGNIQFIGTAPEMELHNGSSANTTGEKA